MYMNPLKTHKPWLKHFVVGCWAFPSTCQAFKRSLFIWIAINAIKNQFIQWWNPRDLEVLDSYFITVFRIELESNFEVRIGRSKDFFRIEKLDLIWKSKFEWFERFRGSVRVWTISKKFRKISVSSKFWTNLCQFYLPRSNMLLKFSKSLVLGNDRKLG